MVRNASYPPNHPPAQKKSSIVESFLNYLTNTKPYLLMFHLFWILISSSALSATYIVSFHFTSLLSLYQEAHDITHFNKNLIISATKDIAIIDHLNKLLATSESNRAYMFRYHNGLAAISGVPFFFQTNTHEVIKPGTSRVLAFHQRIPVSVSMHVINDFVSNKCSVISNIDEMPNSQDYWFFQARGARNVIRCPVFSKTEDLLGFVGIDYTDTMPIDKLETRIKMVNDTAVEITAIYAEQK